MNYQTFRGADVQEALFNVRQALGTDALIESTRHVQNGAGGPLGRTCVEIIAAPSVDGDTRRSAISLAPGAPRSRPLTLEKSAGRHSLAPRASKHPTPPSALDESAVGRELMQLRMMLDELGRGRPIKDRTRAMLAAAGFEGALARTLSTGSGRAAKLGNRELMHWLRER